MIYFAKKRIGNIKFQSIANINILLKFQAKYFEPRVNSISSIYVLIDVVILKKPRDIKYQNGNAYMRNPLIYPTFFLTKQKAGMKSINAISVMAKICAKPGENIMPRISEFCNNMRRHINLSSYAAFNSAVK